MNVPETMSAMILTAHGGPEVLEFREVPVPQPGVGEVLIKVRACGINNTDIKVREGSYGEEGDPGAVATWRSRSGQSSTLTFPRIQGADTVGIVVAVGDQVSTHRIGERVMVDFCIYNRPEGDNSLADIDYYGHGRDGGFAEYMVADSANVHCVDSTLDDAELATFSCAYQTGEHMLERASVKAGERVLVTGAGGGVGSGIIQLCRARGAIPYAVTSRGKEMALLQIGAEAVIARQDFQTSEEIDEEGFLTAVQTAAQGNPIDVVADLVGGSLFNGLLRLLRPEGRYTTAGTIGGAVVSLDTRTMYLKHLQLHGSSQGTRADFTRLVRYIEEGQIKPILSRAYKLSQLHEAQAHFIEKRYIGKLVVIPDSQWHLPSEKKLRPKKGVYDIKVADVEVGGDVHRVILNGIGAPREATAFDSRHRLASECDELRKLLLSYPYGHQDMCANFIFEIKHEFAGHGYVIMESMGYPYYSGSNTIAVAAALLEYKIIPIVEGEFEIWLESPGGLVQIIYEVEQDLLRQVTVSDKGAYVILNDDTVDVAGIGPVRYSLVWSGAYYAMVEAADLGIVLGAEHVTQLKEAGAAIIQSIARDFSYIHEEYGKIEPPAFVHFMSGMRKLGPKHYTGIGATYGHPGTLYRCPTGTGTSARMALLVARGDIERDAIFESVSAMGNTFVGKGIATKPRGDRQVLATTISARPFVLATTTIHIDFDNPLMRDFDNLRGLLANPPSLLISQSGSS